MGTKFCMFGCVSSNNLHNLNDTFKKMKKKIVVNVEKNKILWISDIENNIYGFQMFDDKYI